MAIVAGVPTNTARQWGSQLLSQAQGLGSQAVDLRMGRLQALKFQRDKILANLATLRQREAAKKAMHEQNSLGGDDWGAIGGSVAAIAAAPFTGGASLRALPAFASVGRGVGQLAEGNSGGAIESFGSMGQVADLFIEIPNPFGPSQRPNDFPVYSQDRPSAGFEVPGLDN